MSKISIRKEVFDQLAAQFRMGLVGTTIDVADVAKDLKIEILEDGKPTQEFASIDEFCAELSRKISPASEEDIISIHSPSK